MKYGIIQKQKDETLCERLENIFNDDFKLAKEKKHKGAMWITLDNGKIVECSEYKNIRNLASNTDPKKK